MRALSGVALGALCAVSAANKCVFLGTGERAAGSVCSAPQHPPAPAVNVTASKALELSAPEVLRVGGAGEGAAHGVDVNEGFEWAYVGNLKTGAVDRYYLPLYGGVAAVGFLQEEQKTFKIDGYRVQAVATCKVDGSSDVAAVFRENDGGPGRVVVLDVDLKLVGDVRGAQCYGPENVSFSDDCKYIVATCAGEGKDVPGGVLVASYAEGVVSDANLASFEAFDSKAAELKKAGVRLFVSGKPSLDLEPKGLAVVGRSAVVTLPAANALAVVDLSDAAVTEIKPLGFIDRSKPGFGLDASSKDGGINIRNYAGLYGMPQPSSIVSFTAADGRTYLVTANEGDSRGSEDVRGAELISKLGRTASPTLKKLLEDDAALGGLKCSSVDGYDDETNTQVAAYTFGGRSFSIMNENGEVVFDSGEWLARIQEEMFPDIFNSNAFIRSDLTKSQADLADSRSEEMGSEPTSLAILDFAARNFVFIGFERSTIIVVFDVTVPAAPVFVDAAQNHPSSKSAAALFEKSEQGDIAIEGLFASVRKLKLYVTGAASSTVTTYDVISRFY